MLRSDLCGYTNAAIVVKGKITVEGTNANNKKDKKLAFKNNVLSRSCMLKMITHKQCGRS